jgi:hypothetical protein
MTRHTTGGRDYTVITGWWWRPIVTFLFGKTEFSNCVVIDHKNNLKFRLTDAEQSFFADMAEHSGVMMRSPNFVGMGGRQKCEHEKTVCDNVLDAITANRNGDPTEIERLRNMSQPEFVEYASRLCGLH